MSHLKANELIAVIKNRSGQDGLSVERFRGFI